MMMMLAACGGNKVDSSTAEKYRTKAEEVIHLLNEAQYEELHTMFNSDMQSGLPVEDMTELTPIIEASGSFEKIDKASVEEDKGLYIAVLVAKYQNNKRVYTITFDADDKIAGLYIN